MNDTTTTTAPEQEPRVASFLASVPDDLPSPLAMLDDEGRVSLGWVADSGAFVSVAIAGDSFAFASVCGNSTATGTGCVDDDLPGALHEAFGWLRDELQADASARPQRAIPTLWVDPNDGSAATGMWRKGRRYQGGTYCEPLYCEPPPEAIEWAKLRAEEQNGADLRSAVRRMTAALEAGEWAEQAERWRNDSLAPKVMPSEPRALTTRRR